MGSPTESVGESIALNAPGGLSAARTPSDDLAGGVSATHPRIRRTMTACRRRGSHRRHAHRIDEGLGGVLGARRGCHSQTHDLAASPGGRRRRQR